MSKKPSKGGRRPLWMTRELLINLRFWDVEKGTGCVGGLKEQSEYVGM